METGPVARDGRADQDDSASPILHVDMDAFFASVELADHPGLRGRPMIVGGQERGVVLAATYEARAFGVTSGMPMALARVRCPAAVVLPPRQDVYRRVSRRVMAILADVTPVMQQISVDEAFLDVSGARRRLGPPREIGAAVRARIRDELGLAASVGVAPTMFVAKIASTRAKPDGMLVVPADHAVDFLHGLDVSALWGVGESTRGRLAEVGIRTVAELAHTPVASLRARLGVAAAARLHDLSWGRDPRRVTPTRTERSISSEHTFARDTADAAELTRVMLGQAHTCARRLREAGLLARGVSIKVRMSDFTTLTRSRRLDAPSDLAREVYRAAVALLSGVAIPAGGVRLVGVRADDLVPAAGTALQGHLGEDDSAQRALENVLDDVGRRFPGAATVAASLLGGGSGGRSGGRSGGTVGAPGPAPGGAAEAGSPSTATPDTPATTTSARRRLR
ncbi:DNA polymerase IV [Litorihabitans aurantiacus]|uniref:DNA polymerase IV n=1 Tax=Litorihabitans aurantiacus TaxID=1930061 RepID=UPI0024E1850E|nr:DNA polymerase IV [Litorihabitans aurantiacus]